MTKGRSGQAGAAVLVILTAVLILLYVLFLPPAERAALLGEEPVGVPPSVDPDQTNILYSSVPSLQETQGPLMRSLPSVTLRTVTSGNVLAERSGLSVSRTAFHQEPATFDFTVPEATNNVYLSFGVATASGNLVIRLDDRVIYDSEITSRSPNPIVLPVSEGSYTLTFETSSVGFALWSRNQYDLTNVRITGDVTDFARASQVQRFVIVEPDRTDRVWLEFTPLCDYESGRLTLALNGATVYSGTPECSLPIAQDFALSRLDDGENVLEWTISEGMYIIDDPTIYIQREQATAADSFTVSSELLSRLVTDDSELLMRLTFAQPGARGVILLNGEELAFRTHRSSFAAPITPYVRAGSNEVVLLESDTPIAALEILVQ